MFVLCEIKKFKKITSNLYYLIKFMYSNFIKNLINLNENENSIDTLNYQLSRCNFDKIDKSSYRFLDINLINNSFTGPNYYFTRIIKDIVPLTFYQYAVSENEVYIGFNTINTLHHFDKYDEDCILYDIDTDILHFNTIKMLYWKTNEEYLNEELYYQYINYYLKEIWPGLLQLTLFNCINGTYQRVFIKKSEEILIELKLTLLFLGHPRFVTTLFEELILELFSK